MAQTAAWIDRPGPETKPYLKHDIPIPSPGPGQVLVKLEFSGVCHSDVHAILGETKRMAVNIGGHEGVGQVIELGEDVPPSFMNSRVGVKWLYSACGACEICSVDCTRCPNQSNSGRDVPGTFQQYTVAPAKFVTKIPPQLPSEVAAPLLCAGITVFGAIKKTGLKKGQWIVISGAGGGLGHLGVQISKKMGYRIIAIDTGKEKEKLCKELGAEVYLDYEIDDIEKSVKDLTGGYGAHAVVCTTGSDAAYVQAFQLVRILGTVVCVGLSMGKLQVSPFTVAIRGLKLIGSSVGTEEEMEELLDMAVNGDIVPHVELFDLSELHEVVYKLDKAQMYGKAVLKIPQ
ncbi:Zn-dependent alcohol dehydrogenase [Xylogone sp. PMI_703]|nr:Zn-dependent alcohol dehydrogenase [Xylogone sp. PMI_703]